MNTSNVKMCMWQKTSNNLCGEQYSNSHMKWLIMDMSTIIKCWVSWWVTSWDDDPDSIVLVTRTLFHVRTVCMTVGDQFYDLSCFNLKIGKAKPPYTPSPSPSPSLNTKSNVSFQILRNWHIYLTHCIAFLSWAGTIFSQSESWRSTIKLTVNAYCSSKHCHSGHFSTTCIFVPHKSSIKAKKTNGSFPNLLAVNKSNKSAGMDYRQNHFNFVTFDELKREKLWQMQNNSVWRFPIRTGPVLYRKISFNFLTLQQASETATCRSQVQHPHDNNKMITITIKSTCKMEIYLISV